MRIPSDTALSPVTRPSAFCSDAMTSVARRSLAVVAACFCFAGAAPANGPAEAVNAFVLQEMERQRIPGLALAVVKDGAVVTARGYGLANLEHGAPVHRDTIFQSGSVGKQFTATAVMLLVEDGKLDLDASIRRYLESVPEAYQAVTVRHLLTHTGGIPDLYAKVNLRADYTEDDLLKKAFDSEPAFVPGAKWEYSNTGYAVLGFLISKVSGRHYAGVLQSRVFEPLGMNTARLISEADIIPNRAAGYRLTDGAIRNQEWVSPTFNSTADGSLYLTIDDLIQWDLALAAGKLLKPSSLEQMWTSAATREGKPTGYGFGWAIGSVNGRRLISHTGAWQGFTSCLNRYVDDRLTVMVLANLAGSDLSRIAKGAAALLEPALQTVKPSAVDLQPLFPKDGPVTSGWLVRDWSNVGEPPERTVVWEVKDGILHGTGGLHDDEWIGTWLLSEKEYGDFVVDFDFHLGGAHGNGGLALRAPLEGDPAFDGMELQLTDPRYQLSLFPDATPAQLTGGIYLAIAPRKLAYRPDEWNHARVELKGASLRAWLNGELIHDADLDRENAGVRRHEGTKPVLPISQRPRRGRIGFQDLSSEGDQLRVRNARFAVLD